MYAAPFPRHSRIRLISSDETFDARPGALLPEQAREECDAIRRLLDDGDIEAAYDRFAEWIRREARYAGAGRSANLHELMESMLHMLGWMYERVASAAA